VPGRAQPSARNQEHDDADEKGERDDEPRGQQGAVGPCRFWIGNRRDDWCLARVSHQHAGQRIAP
jgi:hypothetical protein